MEKSKAAAQFLDILFSGEDLDRLRAYLKDDFRFEGPFFQSETADAYLAAMKEEPPVGFTFKVLQTYENEQGVCVIYSFEKEELSTTMCQTFEFIDGKIAHMRLIFDTQLFLQPY
ncbi:nuclear transport factor 2 family protein [Pontibacter sp. G13]|uniref:nuclear transport factor 2 family protein n=1 Tax=Pontibacter sp. G13 TaxID=3074898 RepID=UPI00288B267B|nr:nuclear transport factor 2 family protein [Pontibacter sp. G13]WNJ21244.1 nuclear transport factor 2 family protein [Pontibacter sp. G13]